MSVKLNHTIVYSRDKRAAAAFAAEILGLPEPVPFGPFMTVQVDNELTLDFLDSESVMPQHYAFLVDDAAFDRILARVRLRQLTFWADPSHRRADEINARDGGRGFYFEDPSGHNLEVLTRPYGSA